MAVVSEAGELAAEYRWINSAEADVWSQEPSNRERVAAEAGDVGLALLMFCDRVGIDFVQVMVTKLDQNAQNYPVDRSRGKHSRP